MRLLQTRRPHDLGRFAFQISVQPGEYEVVVGEL